jgi:putative ABC transport system substrate-binding protein
VVGLGLLAGCGRLPWQAQAPAKIPQLGYLSAFAPGDGLTAAFREGLREHGYIEGQNIVIEYRFAEGRQDRVPELAAELVRLSPELIVTSGTGTRAVKEATSTIPIVMAASGDPVGSGLVTSLGRPGGNVTGSTLMSPQLGAKRLELLEAVAGPARVAVLGNGADPAVAVQLKEIQAAAPALGLQLLVLDVRAPEELEAAFETVLRERPGALLVPLDPLLNVHSQRVRDLAAQGRLPTMWYVRQAVEAGGLMAYGPSHLDAHRRAAYYVDRFLKGANPADLPIEQPREFDFVINLKTARALGLTIPQHVLLQATEVIQ